MSNKQKQSFMHGALILMIGGMVVKVIGALYKIPLGGILGPEGMTHFNFGYQIYTIMYIATTAALPVAVSRLVSENISKGRHLNAKRIANVSMGTYMILGVTLALGCFLFSNQIANVFDSPDSKYAISIISLSLIFEVIMSSQWGYFQGYGNMLPTAISQVIIAIGKLGGGLFFAEYLLSKGYGIPIVAAGAIAGTAVGTFFGAIYMTIMKLLYRPAISDSIPSSEYVDSRFALMKRLISITIPIALSSCMLTATNFVDLAMVMRNLQRGAGFSYAEALFRNGSYTGFAVVLFTLPTALILPLGISTVPAIASCYSVGNVKKAHDSILSVLRITMVLALPAGAGFAFMARPILYLLYAGSRLTGNELDRTLDIAAPILSSLGLAVIFVCLALTLNYILQAMGKERIPVVSMLVGGVLKVLSNYILVSRPDINIFGAPVGTTLCYGAITLIDLIILSKLIKGTLSFFVHSVKPFMAAVIACGGAYLLNMALSGFINPKIATIAAIGFAGVVYFALLFYSKGLKGEDVELLPKGEKIRAMLDKRGWLG